MMDDEGGFYFAASTMYWMAALKSASDAVEIGRAHV